MSQELVPYSDIEKMGKTVAASGLFGVKTETQAVALMLIAQAYGKHPMQAAIEYNIINNRPAKKAEAILAAFQEAGGSVQWLELTDKIAKAIFMHPLGGKLELAWTIEMAKAAGLVDKEYSNYKKYPRAMLRSRVVAEGVRAVYPAATGGMLSKEEAEDIVEPDQSKSRVEQIIEAQVEPKETKQEKVTHVEKEKEPAKEAEVVKKTAKKTSEDVGKTSGDEKPNPVSQPIQQSLPEGCKLAQGVITTPAKLGYIGDAKTPKWNFTMGEDKYGTFDKAIFEGLSGILDLQKDMPSPILINIVYKERPSGEKILRDIVSFKQAEAGKDVPI